MTDYLVIHEVGKPIEAIFKDRLTFLAVDISDATSIIFIFTKPSGNIITRNATFKTNGTDGIARYITKSGDIDEYGIWKLQGKIITSDGEEFSMETKFDVLVARLNV